MRNNVFVGALLGSIAPVVIALIAAGVHIGSLNRTVSNLEKEVKELEETSGKLTSQVGSLTDQVGSLTDQVSGLETREPTPARSRTQNIPAVGPPPGSQINFSNSAPWGNWSDPLYCPEGQYVYGLRQKVEPQQGKGDDTAMNAVAFYCRPLPE